MFTEVLSQPEVSTPSVHQNNHYLDYAEVWRLVQIVRKSSSESPEYMQAKHAIVVAYVPLVEKIAQYYRGKGLPMADLISEGNIGVMITIDRFDPKKGRFDTYAGWWIKQRIKEALTQQSRNVRISNHRYNEISAVKRAMEHLSKTLGREPTKEEIAQALGKNEAFVQRVFRDMSAEVRLDQPVDEGSSMTYGDILELDGTPGPDEIVEKAEHLALLAEFLESHLDYIQLDIVTSRMGMNGEDEETEEGFRGEPFESIGLRYGKSREWARGTFQSALIRLNTAFANREDPERIKRKAFMTHIRAKARKPIDTVKMRKERVARATN